MPKKLTQQEFVAKAQAVHGLGKYDYSETVYLPMPQKVAIRCRLHGVFMQKAGQHLVGKGCPGCGAIIQKAKVAALGVANTKWDTVSFRARCLELYPRLDFSRSTYSTARESRICYDCPQHGPLSAVQHTLLSGRAGCRLCSVIDRREGLSNRAQWIQKFERKHGRKYDYSLLPQGLVSEDKVPIVCPVHGLFKQQASNHLSGFGCKKCANAATGERHGLSRVQYLDMFRTTHGERYGYENVPAKFKAKDKVKILCHLHGDFEQSAFEHGHGHGCPKCGIERARPNGPGWNRTGWVSAAAGRIATLYLIRCFDESESFYKIGITSRSIARRFSSGLPYQYEVLQEINSPDAAAIYDLEKQVKRTFKKVQYKPRQPFAGQFECYQDASQLLAFLQNHGFQS